MSSRGSWLVRIVRSYLVDADSAQEAESEVFTERRLLIHQSVEAQPRYSGVADDGPPQEFPGYRLCRHCGGSHWTRDHARTVPFRSQNADDSQTGKADHISERAQ